VIPAGSEVSELQHSSIDRAGRALGLIAKSAAAAPLVTPRALRGTVHDQQGERGKWALLRAGGRLLAPFREDLGGGVVRFKYRLPLCQRGRQKGEQIGVWRDTSGTRANYRGVQSCGSVWHCAHCAPKVAAERTKEVITAIMRHLAAGGEVSLVTLTRQHERENSGRLKLRQALDAMRDALSSAKGSRAWRQVKAAAGVIGSIRAFEITYGEINGFHPHTHEIVFHDKGADLSGFVAVWINELCRRNLAGFAAGDSEEETLKKKNALLNRACVIQGGAAAADYILKFGREPAGGWGIASELTKSHLKHGRGGAQWARLSHATPWELLKDYLAGDAASGELWREYAVEMHGKAQLYWSPGLKKHFGLDDVEDQQIADKPDPVCSQFVGFVNDDDWKTVLQMDARFDVLRAAAIDGPDGLAIYLTELREAVRSRPPPHNGAFSTGGDKVVDLAAGDSTRSGFDLAFAPSIALERDNDNGFRIGRPQEKYLDDRGMWRWRDVELMGPPAPNRGGIENGR